MPRSRPAPVPDLDRLEEMHAHAGEAAQLMKALGNEQRLLVLCNLLERPLSVSEINERVQLSQSALSQHLALLREQGLVETRREAQSIYYSLPPGRGDADHVCAAGDLLQPAASRGARQGRAQAPRQERQGLLRKLESRGS